MSRISYGRIVEAMHALVEITEYLELHYGSENNPHLLNIVDTTEGVERRRMLISPAAGQTAQDATEVSWLMQTWDCTWSKFVDEGPYITDTMDSTELMTELGSFLHFARARHERAKNIRPAFI